MNNQTPDTKKPLHQISSNLWKLTVIHFLTWFMVIMPVIVLYYQQNGLDLQQVFFLQAYFGVWIVIFEIPSGYFADRHGRKTSMVWGTVLLSLGYLFYSLAQGFWWFLAAETFLGLGISFISGADSALLYDTMLQLKQSEAYRNKEAKLHSLGSLSEGLASLLSGVIALAALRYTAVAQFAAVLLSVPFALSLTEPKKHEASATETSWKDITNIVKYSLHQHKELKWMILYAALIGASTFTVVWFVQPLFQVAGLPLGWFGVVWAILQFSVAFFALFADRYEKKLGMKASLASLALLPVLAFVLLGTFQASWALIFLLPFYFVRAVKEPIIKDFINKLCPSSMRATILSVRSMLMRLTFVAIGPFVGWVADAYILSTAFYASAGIFLITSSVALVGLRKWEVI